MKRFLGADREAAVKLAAGRYTQFVHSLEDETIPFANDMWVLAGSSHHFLTRVRISRYLRR